MHLLQEKLLKLVSERNIGDLTLRQIGELIQEKFPQKVKHHLNQLEQKGFIKIDTKNGKIIRTNIKSQPKDIFVSVPILGSANCGPAEIYADGNIDGYLKISRRLLPKLNGIFAIKAQGNSLNNANIKGKNIESGDFVIIDSNQISPEDGIMFFPLLIIWQTLKSFARILKMEEPF